MYYLKPEEERFSYLMFFLEERSPLFLYLIILLIKAMDSLSSIYRNSGCSISAWCYSEGRAGC